MALDNFPAISTNHGLMGPFIKHCGMAPCNSVVDDSLCVLVTFWAGIEILHVSLTAHGPLWLNNRLPLVGELASVLGNILLFCHPNLQHSQLAPVLRRIRRNKEHIQAGKRNDK